MIIGDISMEPEHGIRFYKPLLWASRGQGVVADQCSVYAELDGQGF